MTQLDLFAEAGDYREDAWLAATCYDCAHIQRPIGGFMEPDHCTLLGRGVDRVSGICSEFKEKNV